MNESKNNRREFGYKLAVLSTTSLASYQATLVQADDSNADQSSIEAEVFQRLLGDQFTVTDGQSTCLVRLEDVQCICAKHTCRPESLRRKSAFTVLFGPVHGQLREQSVCRVSHPRLGDHEMFLVPVGGKGNVEAVFA